MSDGMTDRRSQPETSLCVFCGKTLEDPCRSTEQTQSCLAYQASRTYKPGSILPAGPYKGGERQARRVKPQVQSDGGSTDYYFLPAHATELRHLISHKGMSKARGDIFKACYRLGEKAGTDVEYDLKKMRFFIDDLIEMHGRGEKL